MTKDRGFTLVEVLVALAIVAVALAAASRSVALSTDSALEHKLRVLSGVVAENRMAEFAARRAWPGVGLTEGTERQAGSSSAGVRRCSLRPIRCCAASRSG